MNYASLEAFCKDCGIYFSTGEPLARHTSMKIGGECGCLVRPDSEDSLRRLIALCRRDDIPYFILGRGSNVLVSSGGYRGCIIQLGSDLSEISVNGELITACAGAGLNAICSAALEHGLTGMEFAYGIPGSAGGALYMNAGAYGGEMADVAVSCRCIDENGDIITMTREEMELSYRSSVFSKRDLCITSVTVKLSQGDPAEIKARMEELMTRRREKQPLEYPSCGSTFKRPQGYFAAALIEECGLKGYTVGGAQVSEKHSGFVINRGGATFEDVMAVVDEVKRVVLEKKGVELECEMLILR